MNDIAFVFPSPHVKDPKTLFSGYTNIDFDIIYLCSEAKPKILKKDIDLDMSILDNYKVICPIGAEPLKYVCGLTGITKYCGIFVDNKYLPLINPVLVEFKPQYKEVIAKACATLQNINTGKISTNKVVKDYVHITNVVDFDLYLEKLEKVNIFSLDCETTSLSPRKGEVIGITISRKPNESRFINHDVVAKRKKELQKLFKEKVIVFHNSKFDMAFLGYHYEFVFPNIEDTMLLHYCLEEFVGTHGLKPLALKYTDLGDYDRELTEYKKSWCRKNKILLKDFNFGMLPIDILVPYGMKDSDATIQLYYKFKPLVEKNAKINSVYNNILIPGTRALMQLEYNGGPIDVEALVALNEDYEIDIEECTKEILIDKDVQRFERLYSKDFNPNSTAQVQKVLFDIKKLPPVKKTEGGRWSVDKEVLKTLQKEDPLVDAILDLREKTKLQSTYINNIINGIDRDKRLRSNFNIHGTTSGRLSSSGTLNYQNIPRDNKDIKKLFVARPGYKIVQADLGTAEVYYAAVLSKDKFLQEAFIKKLDFHSYIAKQIFNLDCKVGEVKTLYQDQRQYAKAITFGILFQAGPAKIAETANISIEAAKQFIAKYFNEARQLKNYIENSNHKINNNAFIYSFFGRKRRLPESKSTNRGVATHAVRSGVNFLIQSVASDINILGTIDAIKWINEKGLSNEILPFTVVHDSVVAEVKKELVPLWAKTLVGFLQTDRGLSIRNCPIKVDIEVGPSWGELSNYNE